MITQTIIIISVSLQIVVLAVLLGLSVKLIGESSKDITAVFLALIYSLWLLDDLYWLIYDLMRPDTRMPFAANEIAEVAYFLGVAATVNSAVRYDKRLPVGHLAGTLLFLTANVVLWMIWSGEIVQNTVVGLVLAWLFVSIVRSLISENSLAGSEWILLGILCAAVIICQGLTFTVPENLKHIPDLCASILLIAGIVFFTCMFIRSYRGGLARSQMFLAFAILIWTTISKYMSGGNWYNLFLTLETPGLWLVCMSVKKVVRSG